jgi:CBS domain-containing protein
MKKIPKDELTKITAKKEMKLDEVATLLTSNNMAEIDVVNSRKSYLGTVYLTDLVSAMINPIDEETNII